MNERAEVKVVRIGMGYVERTPVPGDEVKLSTDIKSAHIDWEDGYLAAEDVAEQFGGEVVTLREDTHG